jgi:hypothetical protein
MIGVIYDIKLNAVRRIIVSDDDSEVLDGHHLQSGEAMVRVSTLGGNPTLEYVLNAVRAATGREVMDDKAVLQNDAMHHAMGGIVGTTLFT